jgi:imidazole glycerol-phosphate synthase subunit HisH
MKVAVVDHGNGNMRSVVKALAAAGARPSLISDPGAVATADALCLPGQGAFDRCMAGLAGRGLEVVVREWIEDDRPFLGICLGMQVLFEVSEEHGPSKGLGIFPGRVTRLPETVTVPHIGWNTVSAGGGGPCTYFYFDHSFAAHPDDPSIVDGWCEHGERFAARLKRGRLTATQFHPEKSGRAGIQLLRNWVSAP